MCCRPERWTDVPEGVSHVPGIWGHLLTFIGGPRGCIGYRFALVECVAYPFWGVPQRLTAYRFKAILFSLVRAFEFELAVDASRVGSRTAILQRPVLRDDPTHQAQLSLFVRPCQRT